MKEKKKHRLDRQDGYYIENIDAFHKYFAHMNNKRTECEVCLLSKLDITEVLKFIEKENESLGIKTKLFHAILTAMGKMVYNRPKMNIFVSGRRFFQRKKVIFSFVAKKKFLDTAEEAMMMLNIKPEDNFETIAKRVIGDVKEAKGENDHNTGADDALKAVAKFPRWFMAFVMWIFRILDRNGLFPESFTKVDPNYSTILFSNLGSIKCNAVYHHLSNFGTNSILLTIGTIHKEKVLQDDGSEAIKDIVDFGITIDERIADGFYFAKCMKLVQHIVDHPELLLDRVDTVVEYEN